MGDELKTIGESIEALKSSFDKRVGEVKAATERVEKTEAAIEELKTKVTAGAASIAELVEAKEEVKKQRTALDEAEKKLAEVVEAMGGVTKRLDEVEAASKRLPQGRSDERQSVGQIVIASEAYKEFQPGQKSNSGAIPVKNFFPREAKAGELTGASLGNVGSYLYAVQRVPGIIGPAMLQPRVRDLFQVMTTSVGAVEFVRESGFTNLAAVQDEATPAAKAQSVLTFESKSVTVSTIAHWLAAARQIISDAPVLQQYIDSRLIYGLAITEDDEILNGTGGGSHLEGLLTDSDIQLLTQGADDNKADAVRRAMTLVEIAEYSASGIVLHPNDWEDIELLKDLDGRYIWARVQESGVRRLWGLPVVTTSKMDEGSFCTGAFDVACALWSREDATVRISDQHSDFFTKNLVAILAEERLALTVYRPEAAVLGTFTAEGS
jgi:HK97 family phage major capsid protein